MAHTPEPAPVPAYHPPVVNRPAPPPKPVYKPMVEDQCGAAALQYLVGKPRTEIPVPLDPGKRRVVCSSCIVTQEYRSDRQTIVFSSETGLIESVKCG
ncbi:MAG: proteinase inhibitor i78 [Asticcacaulis sp.]|nr:proteinase inhibitor i78 [Asticcacaulis sp.]